MRVLLGAWRLAAAVAHVVLGLLICSIEFPRVTPAKRSQRVGWWSRRLLDLLGIELVVNGAPRVGAHLVVANHVSWLDILAINAVRPVRFVSKADVRRWPLLGWLVACGGTLFIERERKRDAMRVVQQVSEALDAGDTVAVFPEGTTSDGRGLLPFHGNLLQAAIATAKPVQPMALRYSDADAEVSRAAAYVDDMTLLRSAWAVVTARHMRVTVTVLPALGTRHLDRRALAERVRGEIAEHLGVDMGSPGPHEIAG